MRQRSACKIARKPEITTELAKIIVMSEQAQPIPAVKTNAMEAKLPPRSGLPIIEGREEAPFIVIDENPVPEGGQCFSARMTDGETMRVATFPATAPETKSLMLVTGRSEFIEKYFETITDLQGRGFAITAMDWRGQGHSARSLSAREIGHIDDFTTYRADLEAVLEGIAKPFSKSPLYLMSHSMGGPPVLDLLVNEHPVVCGAILCSPMTNFYRSKLKRQLVHFVAESAVRAGLTEKPAIGVKEYSHQFEGNILTSDETRHSRFRRLQEAAPEATISAPTYGWVKAALDIIAKMHEPSFLEKLQVPVLIISAGRDYLIDSDDHAVLAEQSPMISRVVIRHALHEILMERDVFRAQFWEAFDGFVNAH